MTTDFVSEKFMSLVTPDLYLIIAAVYGICYALKQARFFNDRFIPLAAIALGICFELLYFAVRGGNAIEAVLRGVISGMAAVYTANIIKQMGGKGENDI